MEKYDKEYFEEVRRLLNEKAQQLAGEYSETTRGLQIEIELQDEPLAFEVDVVITNEKYEEETNSHSSDLSIYITDVPLGFAAEFLHDDIYPQ